MNNLFHIVNLIADALEPELWSQVQSGAQIGDPLSTDLVVSIDDFEASPGLPQGIALVEAWTKWDSRHRLAAPDTALDIQDVLQGSICLCCEQPLTIEEQRYTHASKVNQQVTCRTPGCKLENVTACVESYFQTVTNYLENPGQ